MISSASHQSCTALMTQITSLIFPGTAVITFSHVSLPPAIATIRTHHTQPSYEARSGADSGGLGIGLAFGIACRYALRFMRYMGATIDQQVSLTLALAYLSYYTANAPAHVSGTAVFLRHPARQFQRACSCQATVDGALQRETRPL